MAGKGECVGEKRGAARRILASDKSVELRANPNPKGFASLAFAFATHGLWSASHFFSLPLFPPAALVSSVDSNSARLLLFGRCGKGLWPGDGFRNNCEGLIEVAPRMRKTKSKDNIASTTTAHARHGISDFSLFDPFLQNANCQVGSCDKRLENTATFARRPNEFSAPDASSAALLFSRPGCLSEVYLVNAPFDRRHNKSSVWLLPTPQKSCRALDAGKAKIFPRARGE